MSFPPGGLSTWKPPDASDGGSLFTVGGIYFDPNAGSFDSDVGSFNPLNVKDLVCPTWGLGISGTSDNGIVVKTIGPPWLPLISPPTEVFSLDPTWALLCTGMMTDPMNIPSLALFDPPIALTPGLGLVAPPVVSSFGPTSVPASNFAYPTTVKEGTYKTEAAKPASSPGDLADPPARTGAPGLGNFDPSLAIVSNSPAESEAPPGEPVATPTDKNDPPIESNVPLPVAPAVSAVGAKDSPADPIVPSSDAADAPHDDSQNVSKDSKAPPQSGQQRGIDAQPQTQGQGLGALIYNAFNKFGPVIGGNENGVNTIPVPSAGVNKVTIGRDQVLSVDSSGVTFQGKTYWVGGPAMTLSNSVYTLVAQPESWVDADDGQSRGGLIPAAPDTLTIAGQTVVPNPTGIVTAGSSVLPGGSAVIIFNTPISLAPSGILVVGSSSLSLSPQSVFNIGVLPFTANPSGFILNGAIISPGGAAQTLDGTRISLGQAGVFEIGSTTISLLTPSSPPRILSTFTVASQTFTLNPTAFSTIGTTISAGGPAITIAGTIISFGPSGTLIVGSSTIVLSAPQTPLPSLVNTDGLSIEAQSSLAIVDGVTISPGAPGVTVDRNIVSLEAGGKTLDIGTGRFAMPTEGANGSREIVAFEGGQEKGMPVSLLFVLLCGIGGSLITLMG